MRRPTTWSRTDDLRALWAEENKLLEAGDVDGATDLNVRRWIGPDADDDARELLRTMQKRAFDVQLAAGDDLENEEYAVEPGKITCAGETDHRRTRLQVLHRQRGLPGREPPPRHTRSASDLTREAAPT